jgi:release factor glutamine methyltransferase
MKKLPRNLKEAHLKKETQWLLEEKYGGEKTAAFFSDIARLKKGEPVDYVIGFVPFLGCYIDLSDFPLIPRTETEFWVERAIQEILCKKKKDTEELICCLDLFSGSGCIGIPLLHHIKSATVDFSDKEPSCLQQIQKNVKKNNIDVSRAHICQSDCFEHIPRKKYDYIFANPPYIARKRKEKVQESVVAWESHDALFAEDDGLYYIKKIIREAPNFLVKGGTLFVEFDSCQKETIEKFIPKNKYTYTFWKDQFGKWRTLILQKK